MSLIKKQQMTVKNLAAKRGNARKGRGPATPGGKANSARANLRHGFYAQQQDQILLALGEDPRECAQLMNSLENDLAAALKGQLVQRIGYTLWRMKRAERMQNGLALRRMQNGLKMEHLVVAPDYLHHHEIYQRLVALGTKSNDANFNPSPAEIQEFETGFGNDPPAGIQKVFPLLRSFAQAAEKALRLANENGGTEHVPSAAGEQEREWARQELREGLTEAMLPYRKTLDSLAEKFDRVRSPENMAALMAPKDKSSLLMQRMEDSNLRQLWRLTRMFMMIDRAAGEAEISESRASGDYVNEKTGG